MSDQFRKCGSCKFVDRKGAGSEQDPEMLFCHRNPPIPLAVVQWSRVHKRGPQSVLTPDQVTVDVTEYGTELRSQFPPVTEDSFCYDFEDAGTSNGQN